ncbi:hypothetical protein [Treponema sp. Marseille-Q4132]|uniref:hypothetical protein n=1 Tax=Treponema sp. Marseille-Q4132 TaxID=2766701 RepID=UPI001652D024|nr:hypothetical protein [Treponema sp. Marseille-Q4132]QNL97483.1 hypothetical protein H9I35_01645 [Treponema sp. Marseille-Q4132]
MTFSDGTFLPSRLPWLAHARPLRSFFSLQRPPSAPLHAGVSGIFIFSFIN